jgi:hypothetical protein
MPTANDTRPAEVWTRKTTDYDLVEIEACMHAVKDDHYLIDNYKIEQIENLHTISIMKRDGRIVGFSGVQDIELGSRILSRLYQTPDNRVQFTRELLRPTIHAMLEHQSLLVEKNAIISREKRQANYFKRFVGAINKKSTHKWKLTAELYETVPNSWQYIAWREE